MKSTALMVIQIAEELISLAKTSMPKLRNGEVVQREAFENGIYQRETVYENTRYVAEYNFRSRECRFINY